MISWILSLAAMAGIAVLALVVWKAKSRKSGPVPGHFDFGRHKARELSKRGLFNHTKWR
jgi:hypothetical protein